MDDSIAESFFNTAHDICQKHWKEEQKKREDGDFYNIFTELKRHRKEITHSKILHGLLNPKGDHGQKDFFVKILLERLGHKTDYGWINVCREKITDDNKRIDLVIETNELLIGIEIKIYAQDLKHQLFRYYKYLQSKKTNTQSVHMYYLTLDGHFANSNSLLGNSQNGSLPERITPDQYIRISFRKHIIPWLRTFLDHSELKDKPVLKLSINQYLSILNTICKIKDEDTMDLKKEIKKTTDNLRVASEISKNFTEIKIEIQKKFWTLLQAKLQKKFPEKRIDIFSHDKKTNKIMDTLVEGYYAYPNRKEPSYGIKFEILQLKKTTIYAYVKLYHAIHYGFRLEKNGSLIADKRTKKVVQDILTKHKQMNNKYVMGKADNHPNWLICFYSNGHHKTINFSEFNDGAFFLADDAELDRVTSEIETHLSKFSKEVLTSRDLF